MAGARISREKGLSGWQGRVFLEKMACLDGWGAYLSRKRLVWMAGARISRENGLSGWLGRVFLEKKACLDGWGAYFSRKRLAWMAGGTSSEIQEISLEFSFMVLVNNSFLKVVILGNLCGGGFQDPPRRVSWEGLSGWQGRVFLEKKACLDGWGAYFS